MKQKLMQYMVDLLRGTFNPFTAKCSQRQISTKLANFLL